MIQTDSDRASAHAKNAPKSVAPRFKELLSNYSSSSEADLVELVTLYRELTPVEISYLRSDGGLVGTLDRFRSDHRKQLRTPFRDYAALVIIPICGVVLFAIVLLPRL